MLSNKIPEPEITLEPLSERDTSGRVFYWQQQIYRGIKVEKAPFFLDLWQRGIIPRLIEQKLLVETEITDLKLNNFALVLEHRLIPFISYPWEWCDLMFKDATLLHLELCLELARHDLVTKDAYPLNILFDGVRPVFVDFCSIESAQNFASFWTEYAEFGRLFINPLRLMCHQQQRIARWLLQDIENGVLGSEVRALTPLGWQDYLPSIQTLIQKARYRGGRILQKETSQRIAFFSNIYRQVERLKLPPVSSLTNERTSPVKKDLNKAIAQILSDLQPRSVLDVNGSQENGCYSRLAARGSRVVSFHREETAAKRLYLTSKAQNLDILPLLIDCYSPCCGLSNDWFLPLPQRFSCDLVLAIGLMEYLVFRRKLSFSKIVAPLAALSKRWLLIEFTLPTSDRNLAWYRLDRFIQALESHCFKVKTVFSDANSYLLLCEKLGGVN